MAYHESLLPYLDKVSKARNPAEAKLIIFEAAGDLKDIAVPDNKILVGVYARSERLGKLGLLVATDRRKAEDQWSSNVGLLLKKGPVAFKYEWEGKEPGIGDWLLFKPAGTALYGLRKAAVRFMKSTNELIDSFGFEDPGMWD